MEKRESPTEKEEGLRKYVYRDNSASGEVVFECIARGTLEADKLYEEKTGINPEKQNYVGCSVEKIDADEKNQ